MEKKKKFEEIVNAEPKVGMVFESITYGCYVVIEVINNQKVLVANCDGMEYKYKQGEDGFLYLDDKIIFEWDREQISKRSDGFWYKVGEHKYQFCGFMPATYHN